MFCTNLATYLAPRQAHRARPLATSMMVFPELPAPAAHRGCARPPVPVPDDVAQAAHNHAGAGTGHDVALAGCVRPPKRCRMMWRCGCTLCTSGAGTTMS